MESNLAIVMLLGFVLVLTGYFLSTKFKDERQKGATFLPATFISKRAIILYLSLLMKIAGMILVITSIMLMFS